MYCTSSNTKIFSIKVPKTLLLEANNKTYTQKITDFTSSQNKLDKFDELCISFIVFEPLIWH